MQNDETLDGQEPTAQPEKPHDENQEPQTTPAPEPSAPESTLTETTPSASEQAASSDAPTVGPETDQDVGSDEAGDKSPGIEALKPGMQVRGRVRRVVDFGAFVDVGVGRDGLAHISTLKRAGIDQTVKPGDRIDVVVRRVDVEANRISLAVVAPDAESKIALRDLEVDAVVTGRVVRLADFGAFVDIGARTDGLLHISQLSHGFVNHPSEVLSVGEEVEVRILDVDTRKRRISLSMKGLGGNGTRATADDASAEMPIQEEESSGERLPTAFEVAFQEAQAKMRRQRRRADN